MSHSLQPHPSSPCDAVTRIDVDVARPRSGGLQLRYAVSGTIAALRLPALTVPARSDELWRHTCFEAFIRAEPGAAYGEFNFAPSTQWAAYRFSNYREGMAVAGEIAAPHIDVQSSPQRFEMQVSLDLNSWAGLSAIADWRIGLSAVIEETNGRKSYWALAHPPGKPDFHHADGFAIELPGVSRA